MTFRVPTDVPVNTGDRKASSHLTFLEDVIDGIQRNQTLLLTIAGADTETEGIVRIPGTTDDAFKVVAQSVPSMRFEVKKGVGFMDGAPFFRMSTYTSGLLTAPVSDDRIDVISFDPDTQTVVVTEGTESASPSAEPTPTDHYKLGEIYLRPGATSIKNTDDASNGYITDSRTMLPFEFGLDSDDFARLSVSNTFTQNQAIEEDGDSTGWDVSAYGASKFAYFNGYGVGGTVASPAAGANGQVAARFGGRIAYNGTPDFGQLGRIDIASDGAPGSGDTPGKIVFYTTPDGSATERTVGTFWEDGLFSLNYNLQVDGAAEFFGDVTVQGSSGDVIWDEVGTSQEFTYGGANTILASHASGSLVFQTGGANTRYSISSAGVHAFTGAATFSSTIAVTSTSTLTGSVTLGSDASAGRDFAIRVAASNNGRILWYGGGDLKWNTRKNTSDNWEIARYTGSPGSQADVPVSINHSTGEITFTNDVNFNDAIMFDDAHGMYIEPSGSTLNFGANSASALTAAFTNAGAGTMSVSLDGDLNLTGGSTTFFLQPVATVLTFGGNYASDIQISMLNSGAGTCNFTLDGKATLGDLEVSTEALFTAGLVAGAAGSSRGYLAMHRGSGTNTPSYIMLTSCDGTTGYLYMRNNRTLAVHTAVPTANTDGTLV